MDKRFFVPCLLCAGLAFSSLFFSCRSLPSSPAAPSSAYTVKTVKENLSYVESDIAYPSFEGIGALDAAVKDAVLTNYNSFKVLARKNWTDLDAYRREEPGAGGVTPPFEYNVQHKVFRGKRFVSVLLTSYEYDGGAHGNTTLRSFTYDVESGKIIPLTEASALSYAQLSALCRQKLVAALVDADASLSSEQRRLLTAMIDSGTAADAEHFSCFTIDGKTITVYFEPYAVAPYAYGTQTVQLPLP
ncbi:MAG TPA: hypothetical protein DDW78_05250 [Treponema sp.]|nr:hypothetical protein [Treponema sp.]